MHAQLWRQVSYVLAPNPMRPGEEIATQARAEGEGARRLGVVKVWHNNKKFGFITETAGERRDHFIADPTLPGWGD